MVTEATTPVSFSALIKDLVTVAKQDAGKVILPLIINFINAIAANPTKLVIVVQLAKLQADVMAAMPEIAQDELKTLASFLSQEALALESPTT